MDWDMALETGSIGAPSGLMGDRMADVRGGWRGACARRQPLHCACGKSGCHGQLEVCCWQANS